MSDFSLLEKDCVTVITVRGISSHQGTLLLITNTFHMTSESMIRLREKTVFSAPPAMSTTFYQVSVRSLCAVQIDLAVY